MTTPSSSPFATSADVIAFLNTCTDDAVATLLLERGDAILQAEMDRTARLDAKGNMLLTAGAVAAAFAVTLPATWVRGLCIGLLLGSVILAVLSQLAWGIKGWSVRAWMAPESSLEDAKVRTLQYVVTQVALLQDRRHSNAWRAFIVQAAQVTLALGIALLAASLIGR
jgi:hypothetical protein